VDELMDKLGIADVDPDAGADDTDKATSQVVFFKGQAIKMELDGEGNVVTEILAAGAGSDYPHVFQPGGDEGNCKFCGYSEDANLHVPAGGFYGDPLNPQKLPTTSLRDDLGKAAAEGETKVDVSLAGSFEDTYQRISAALSANPPAAKTDGAEVATFIEATFADHVLVSVAEFSIGEPDADGYADIDFLGMHYVSYPYTMTEGACALGTPTDVDVAGVVVPKTGEPEKLVTKTISAIEDKVGRTLSASNADKIRSAVNALVEVLTAAGVLGDESVEKTGENADEVEAKVTLDDVEVMLLKQRMLKLQYS
jgi:hypothetical protein